MVAFEGSKIDEKETKQVTDLLSKLINELKDDTKASEKEVRNLLKEYAEDG